MKRLNLVLGVIIGIVFTCGASLFLVALWLLGAPEPFEKWQVLMDSLVFFDDKKK